MIFEKKVAKFKKIYLLILDGIPKIRSRLHQFFKIKTSIFYCIFL